MALKKKKLYTDKKQCQDTLVKHFGFEKCNSHILNNILYNIALLIIITLFHSDEVAVGENLKQATRSHMSTKVKEHINF